MSSSENSSHQHRHHHHKHKKDSAERFKNHTLSAARRRKLLSKILFGFMCIAAMTVVLMCALSFFIE